MLKEFWSALIATVTQALQPVHVFEDNNNIHVLIRDQDGKANMKVFEKPAPGRCHLFLSKDSLVSFLNGNLAGGGVDVVFVGKNAVHANLDYHKRGWDRCAWELIETPAFKAMQLLSNRLSQRELWELLQTKLQGYLVDDKITLQIANISVTEENESLCRINVLGTNDRSASSIMKLVVPSKNSGGDEDEVVLPTEIEWRGPVWQGFRNEYSVTLRLFVDVHEGLTFRFTPKHLEEMLLEARADLVKELRVELPGLSVFEGEHSDWTREVSGEALPCWSSNVIHNHNPQFSTDIEK